MSTRDEKIITGKFRGRPLGRILSLVWVERQTFFLALGFLALGTAMDLVFPRVLKLLVDSALVPAVSGAPHASILPITIGLAVIILVRFFAQWRHARHGQRLAFSVMHQLRDMLFRHVPRLSVSYFDRTPTGRLMTRLTNDVNAIQDFLSSSLFTFQRDILIIAGSLAMLWSLSPVLAAVQALIVLALASSTQIVARIVRKYLRETTRLSAALNARLRDTLDAYPAIQAFSAQERFMREGAAINERDLSAGMAQVRWSGVYQPIMAAGGYVATGVVLLISAGAVARGELSLGSLLAAIAYSELLFGPVRDLAEKYMALQVALAAAERVYEIVDEPVESRAALKSIDGIRAFPLILENVHFSYEPSQPVLRGVSLSIMPNQVLGVLGATGSGKSSLLSLLMGFYDGYQGIISAGQTEVRELPIPVQRRFFCYLGQAVTEPRESITDLISGEEEKLLWNLTSRDGSVDGLTWHDLSSGQKQLLFLISALRTKAPILLLDEVTANLDHTLAREVFGYIRRKRSDAAIIIVTHRPSEVTDCDEIIVLSEGTIAERGTHAELLKKAKLYARLTALETVE